MDKIAWRFAHRQASIETDRAPLGPFRKSNVNPIIISCPLKLKTRDS